MTPSRGHFKTIGEYINTFPEDVRKILNDSGRPSEGTPGGRPSIIKYLHYLGW
jgi:hypothetical protein